MRKRMMAVLLALALGAGLAAGAQSAQETPEDGQPTVRIEGREIVLIGWWMAGE